MENKKVYLVITSGGTKIGGKEDFLTFGDNYLLIEFSFLESPRNLYDILFKLQLEGYTHQQ